jgi:hypothetical protein
MPVIVAAPPKAFVYGRSATAIVVSNPTEGMDVCCVLSCRGLCDGLSLVRMSATNCGASLCVIKKPRGQGAHSPQWAAEPDKKK